MSAVMCLLGKDQSWLEIKKCLTGARKNFQGFANELRIVKDRLDRGENMSL